MLYARLANTEDAELIADMSRHTFYDTFATQNTKANMDKFMNESFTTEALIKEVGAPGNIFILAYDDQEPVGYARMRENNNPPVLGDTPSMEIARIYAVHTAIGKGVGNLLMRQCVDIARKKAQKSIWLGVWEKNERAIAFYTKWGFEKFSDHIFMLGNDPQNDWLMKKAL
jgi:diamine N-acetyltransferase